MKAGVAAMILAMDCVVSAGIKLKGDIILESGIDEETGGNGTLACILRGYRAIREYSRSPRISKFILQILVDNTSKSA